MSHYYINKNPQPSPPEHGEHEIHNDDNDCPKPPLQENRIGLGNFSNCRDATAEAKRRFPEWKIDGCELCNKECHRI